MRYFRKLFGAGAILCLTSCGAPDNPGTRKNPEAVLESLRTQYEARRRDWERWREQEHGATEAYEKEAKAKVRKVVREAVRDWHRKNHPNVPPQELIQSWKQSPLSRSVAIDQIERMASGMPLEADPRIARSVHFTVVRRVVELDLHSALLGSPPNQFLK